MANLNTDVFLPLVPLTGLFEYGFDESDLADDIEAVARARAARAAGPLDFDATAGFNAMYAELALRVANRATRPAWRPTSYFARLRSATPTP